MRKTPSLGGWLGGGRPCTHAWTASIDEVLRQYYREATRVYGEVTALVRALGLPRSAIRHRAARLGLSLIGALLLSHVSADNPNDPRFIDATGPHCTTARQLVKAGCTETFEWDGPPAGVEVTGWEIERRRGGATPGAWSRVGLVPFERMLDVQRKDVNGVWQWVIRGIKAKRLWTPVNDWTTDATAENVPLESTLYDYRVRVLFYSVVGDWTPIIGYRGANMWCFSWTTLPAKCV
jgi:hypothetical protein